MSRDSNIGVNLLIRARDTASQTVTGLTKRMGGLRSAIAGVGTAIGSYFSARAITGFFKGAVQEAAGLEQALSRVGAVTRATPADMARLKAAAEEMGAATKFTAAEAAAAMEELGRAGLNVDNTLQALPSVLSLAAGQSLELAQAADIVAGATAGMQMSFEQSGRVADVLALAASSAKTDVEGLSTALSYAAPNAVAAGLEIEELAAYVGTLATAGYDGSRSGTALSRMMAEFVNPASNMRKALAGVGITTDNFTKAMEQLQAKGDDALPVIVSLGQRAGPALRTLLGQGIEGVQDLTDRLQNAEGAAGAAADRMGDNLNGAITALKSAWSALKITLVDPLLEPITEQVRELTERIRTAATDGSLERLRQSLVAAFERGVAAVKEFVASFGTVEEAFDTLAEGVSATLEWFSRLANAGKLVGNVTVAAFKAVDSAVSAVGTAITSVVTVVAKAVNGIVQGLNAIGVVSDHTALKSAALVETLDEMADALAKRTVDSARASAEALGRATENIAALGTTAEDAAPKIQDVAAAAEEVLQASVDLNHIVFASAEAFDAWAAAVEKAEQSQSDLADTSGEAGTAVKSLRDQVTEAREQLLALIRAGADMAAITKASHELERAQAALSASTGQAAAAADGAAAAQQKMGERSAEAEAQIRALRARVEEAREALVELNRRGADMELVTHASRQLKRAQDDLTAALRTSGDTAVQLAQDVDDLEDDLDDLEDTVVDTSKAFEQWTKQVEKAQKLKTALDRLAELDRLQALRKELDALHQAGVVNAEKHQQAVEKLAEKASAAWSGQIQQVNALDTALDQLAEIQRLNDLRTEIDALHESGVIGSEQHAEALESLSEQHERVAEAQSAALNRQRDANDEVQRSGDVAEEAADRTESAQQQVSRSATSMFAAVRNAYAGMSEAMRDWYDGQLKRVRSLTEWYSRFNDIQFERHRAAFQGLADDADRLEDALRSGTFTAQDMQHAMALLEYDTATARSGIIALGDERLAPLRAAIDAANQRIQDLGDSASDTLQSLREELMRLRGEEDELERLRRERRRAEIEAQMAEARAQGNDAAVRTYQEALQVLEAIGREEDRQREDRKQDRQSERAEVLDFERERTRRTRERADLDRDGDGMTASPARVTPPRTVIWEIRYPGGRGQVEVVGGQEQELDRMMRELELAAGRRQ